MKSGTQKEKIVAFIRDNPGKTSHEIAIALEIRPANVSSVLIKDLYAQGGPTTLKRKESPDGVWIYFVA